MALPYDNNPFGTDPALEELTSGALPFADPYTAELEAMFEAEEAAQALPPGPPAPVEGEILPTPAPPYAPVPIVEPDIEAEIMAEMVFNENDQDLLPQDMAAPVEEEMVFNENDQDLLPQDMAAPVEEEMVFQEGDPDLRPEDLGVPALEVPAAGDPEAPLPEDLTSEALAFRADQFEAERQADIRAADAEEAKRKLERAEIYEESVRFADEQTAALIERAEEHAKVKLDKDRWVKNQSWGQKAAGILTIIASGQLGVLTGRGGDDGINFILGEINRDIEEQKFNIQNEGAAIATQKGLVAQLYRSGKSVHEAAATASIAMHSAAIAEIESQAARVDPNGATAARLEQNRRAFAAAKQSAVLEAREAHRKVEMEKAELEIEAATAQAEINLKQAQTVAKWDDAGYMFKPGVDGKPGTYVKKPRGPGKAKQPKVGSVAEQEHLVATGYLPYKDANGLRIPAPGPEAARLRAGGSRSGKDVPISEMTPEQLKTRKMQGEARNQDALALKHERETGFAELGVDGIVDKKGNPILFPSLAIATEVGSLRGKTTQAIDVIDDMLGSIQKYGWSSDLMRSPEWQRAKVNEAELVNIFKDTGGYGVIAGADLDLIHAQSGTFGDITQIRSPEEGLRQARANLEKKLTHHIRGYRPAAKQISIPEREYVDIGMSKGAKSIDITHPINEKTGERESAMADPIPEAIRGNKNMRRDHVKNLQKHQLQAASRAKGVEGEFTGDQNLIAIDLLPDYVDDDERVILSVPLIKGTRNEGHRVKLIKKAMGSSGMSKAEMRKPLFVKRMAELQKGLEEAGAFGDIHPRLDVYLIVTGEKNPNPLKPYAVREEDEAPIGGDILDRAGANILGGR